MGTVEMRLPFKTFYGLKYKKVGFRFNILSWSILCQLFEPEIEFHQIDELQKTNPLDMFEKMVMAGIKAYQVKYDNPVVTKEDIKLWLYKLPAEQRDKIVTELQLTILNSKLAGKMLSEIITESKEPEKKN